MKKKNVYLFDCLNRYNIQICLIEKVRDILRLYIYIQPELTHI